MSDSRGRVHRGGESERDVLGHSRGLMVYLPWIAMTSAASALLRRPPGHDRRGGRVAQPRAAG
ncbi:hypothetical protein [Streptomyces sp. NPDC014995]|uniref:hypothetical protein n=1 Tax=Streptomyces sp. NPDC014995 TaxID=3364936 RepID=UPI0036FBE04A